MAVKRVETQFDSKKIELQTGALAKQADGAVVVACGETVALVTAVASPTIRAGIDFFPLTVDVEERVYSVGRIPGAVFRREGRPSEKAILTARMTDRPLRPSFPDWFRHDVQIIATVMQFDGSNPWDVHLLTAASAALTIGGVPFEGPISGVRVAHIRGAWVPFPTDEELDNATIELIVAGRKVDGDVQVMMVESGAFEHTYERIAEGAPAPTEDVIIQGLEAAKPLISGLCDLQLELAAQCEIPERTWVHSTDYEADVFERVSEAAVDRLRDAFRIAGKHERNIALDEIEAEVMEKLAPEFEDREAEIKGSLRALKKKIVRGRVLEEGVRMDGRGVDDLRPLAADVGVLPRTHGTGLFQRGETQALSITTLAMPRMEQIIGVDELRDESRRYMHHYYFPPFSTGEAYPLRGPNRRAIGHGELARKAVVPSLPSEDEFPYAIRIVSEILESNGSTSMASVCGQTLALMDAGVPIRDPVAGISIGLISDGDRYVTITDILGAEDNYGDMDFKVAGTKDFVTAIQLDLKLTGIPVSILAEAMVKAKEARMKILDVIHTALPAPRPELSPYAPRIVMEQIPVDKIGEVIGPKGKVINDIIARTDTQIDVDDDGRILIASTESDKAEQALKMIRDIVSPPMLEIGQEFDGKVVKITDFGAFVNISPGKDGLVHISKLGRGKRIAKVEDVVNVGDELRVKVSEIRPDGKLNLVPVDGDEVQTEE
ncbi:MAG TPA: polyribonucleotide nucleotidyltransferase [Actinomycetota bacterium]|jgi:polyribonucleotide nucleotidyltransferase|nr:polyribonucleotide nucleotidyltransferase [Actinomycetota bacterium]